VLLLEATDRTGGRLWSEGRGSYWLNWGAHVFSGPGSATGQLIDEAGAVTVPVPGELAALAMNGRLLTDGRVLTYPFRVPMPWASRLALLRAGAKVRLAVRRYGAACAPRAGDAPGALQQRVYDFLGDRSFADFTGPLPPDADADVPPDRDAVGRLTRAGVSRSGCRLLPAGLGPQVRSFPQHSRRPGRADRDDPG